MRSLRLGIAVVLMGVGSACSVLGGEDSEPASATAHDLAAALSGHSLGAAGVLEAIYSLLMLQHGFIAGTKNLANVDEKITDMPLVGPDSREARLSTVMSNSFGFGGTNASLVFETL